MTEAHETGDVAELVCSNSLKSNEPENAHGLLKEELRVLGSALLECAERAGVPGGKALVVDRRKFSAEVQSELSRLGVDIERSEVNSLPPMTAWYRARSVVSDPHQPTVDLAENRGQPHGGSRRALEGTDPIFGPVGAGITVIATGPLTSTSMAGALQALLGTEHLFFYDAIAPIVSAESLDMSRVFEGSRYDTGSDYLNCPMTQEEYDRFVTALLEAELYPLHEFEKPRFFEGCLPVEEIARRGRLALAFGPMKPVGLVDPRTGRRPFAVVQLRRENVEGTMHNLVGFQTRLKQGEQERIFKMIPGLEGATFLGFGSIHRNTYLDSPKVLLPTLQTRASPDLLVAGQLAGVEGYVESMGAGLIAGINAARLAMGDEPVEVPRDMMLGSLLAYISAQRGLENPGQSPAASTRPQSATVPVFQPMNANFGLLPRLENPGQSPAAKTRPQSGTVPVFRLRGRDKRSAMAGRALEAARGFALTAKQKRA